MKNLLIVDVKTTDYQKNQRPEGFLPEIINISGGILEVNTLTLKEEFSLIAKPILFPILSTFCKKQTALTQEDVDGGIEIGKVFSFLEEFQSKHDFNITSWDSYDFEALREFCRKFSFPFPFLNAHVALKYEYSNHFKFRLCSSFEKVLAIYQLKFEGILHKGIDNVKNITKIAIKMIEAGWEPKWFSEERFELFRKSEKRIEHFLIKRKEYSFSMADLRYELDLQDGKMTEEICTKLINEKKIQKDKNDFFYA